MKKDLKVTICPSCGAFGKPGLVWQCTDCWTIFCANAGCGRRSFSDWALVVCPTCTKPHKRPEYK